MKISFILSATLLLLISTNSFAKDENLKLDLFGFVKASYLSVDNVSSEFKPFFAKRENGNAKLKSSRKSQISTKMSRFGIAFNHSSKTSGVIEIDFDGGGSNQAGATGLSSTSDSDIRTRLLNITHKFSNKSQLSFGKRWDTFGAIKPHTYSLTIINFNQGNTGFLTEAVEYQYSFKDIRTYIQLQTTSDIDAFNISTPIVSFKLESLDPKNLIGLAIKKGEALTKEANNTASNIKIEGLKIFFAKSLFNTSVKAEAYMGKNLGAATSGASLGHFSNITTSAPASGLGDIKENGYFLSLKKNLDKLGVFGGIGESQITNPKDVLNANTQITKNTAIRLGIDHLIDTNTMSFIEFTHLTTKYHQSATAFGSQIDIGMIYKF